MPRNRDRLRALAAVALGLSAVPAIADDFNPPPWRLSNPSATVQEWDFNTSAQPLQPDGSNWGSGGGGYVNPNGAPSFDFTTGAWAPVWFGRSGVWVLPGGAPDMWFTIPNHAHTNGVKKLWMQITWLGVQGSPFDPVVEVSAPNYFGTMNPLSSIQLADGWTHSTYTLDIQGCPPFERIRIANPWPVALSFDQVVVDTICIPVPEPATMAAMGIGTAALLRRRRSKTR